MAEKQKTYELDGTVYHLHYTIGRLEQIEQATGSSVVSAIYGAVRQQMMPLSLLLMLFAYGMMSEDGVYAPLKKAAAYAQERLAVTAILRCSCVSWSSSRRTAVFYSSKARPAGISEIGRAHV